MPMGSCDQHDFVLGRSGIGWQYSAASAQCRPNRTDITPCDRFGWKLNIGKALPLSAIFCELCNVSAEILTT
ncbi:hypothetical protein CGGC5_v016052 [Colletotrichum fructicola Nara gc5]|uniref:Uncharacterized protein n=1 Tax=Colletotrichum fructicola (strain Nara gc5) TaxID=1213859 RepID=A0A7J6IGK6_COLFN|nr:hypothetical protein CGGC5_v016052 [Colletotrichum fructicola Nara gc5]